MKKIYFIIVIIITASLSGQENLNNQAKNGEVEKFHAFSNADFNDLTTIVSNNNNAKDIRVYDLFGKIALKEHTTNRKLNISNLDTGIYIVQVTENTKTTSRKLVVK
jgi:hypothetical protein